MNVFSDEQTLKKMAPRDENIVDKIFAGSLDDLPPLSSKVRIYKYQKKLRVLVSFTMVPIKYLSFYLVFKYWYTTKENNHYTREKKNINPLTGGSLLIKSFSSCNHVIMNNKIYVQIYLRVLMNNEHYVPIYFWALMNNTLCSDMLLGSDEL